METIRKKDRPPVAGIGLPEDLILEVLVRVDIKTLHKAKCVCKAWLSIIEDPRFRHTCRAHRVGRLVLSIPEPITDAGPKSSRRTAGDKIPRTQKVNFFSSSVVAEGIQPGQFFRNSSAALPDCTLGVTKVVNGLACVYDTGCESTPLLLCNIWTGETMWLPEIKYQRIRYGTPAFNYYFGYDDTRQVYKLLRLTNLQHRISVSTNTLPSPYFRIDSEILTLGHDSFWRNITGVNIGLFDLGVFCSEVPLLVKGVMYWVMSFGHDRNCVICFDVKKEKFRLIPPPQDPSFMIWGAVWPFAEIGGRPALYQFKEDVVYGRHLFFYLLDDDHQCSWSSHSIPVPSEFEILGAFPVSADNLPTGQTLFVNQKLLFDIFQGSTTIYSYDHQTKKFGKLLVGAISDLKHSPLVVKTSLLRRLVNYVPEESIIPLEEQLSGA